MTGSARPGNDASVRKDYGPGVDLTPQELAESVAELVRIPSVNSLQAGPAAGEAGELALAHHLAERFRELGAVEVVLDEVAPGRPNVYATFRGRTDRLVVIDGHTDTVGVEAMTDPPFDGRIEAHRVWGRGALDSKATMGVVLALLGSWQRLGVRPEPTLMVAGTVSEEDGGLPGALRFAEWARQRDLGIDQLLVAEPTELAPVHGHKGGIAALVTTVGRSAHGALPHLGVNAIEAMAPVISAVTAEHQRLQTVPATTELGAGTMSVMLISGGSGSNLIPDRCSILVVQRLVPGEDPDDAFARLEDLVRAASPVPVEVVSMLPPLPDGRLGAAAWYQSPDTPLVQELARLAGARPAVAPYGTNALCYRDTAGEVVVFGPGCIDDAHQPTESVNLDDLARTADVLTGWLRPA